MTSTCFTCHTINLSDLMSITTDRQSKRSLKCSRVIRVSYGPVRDRISLGKFTNVYTIMFSCSALHVLYIWVCVSVCVHSSGNRPLSFKSRLRFSFIIYNNACYRNVSKIMLWFSRNEYYLKFRFSQYVCR